MAKQEKRTEPAIIPDKVGHSKKNSFQVAEAYKMIRTNLLFALATQENRAVVFSSAEPGAGKSTLSANLAIVMAQTGARVVLVDADMRKPSQHRNFQVPRTMGLSKILCGLNSIEECLVKNVKPGLDLIPAGTIPPNPSELLGSERMEMLLEALQEQYDYVFLDMPPLCVVADALVVAPKTAGVVLVARYRSTTYEEMGEAVESVRNANIPMLGVVLSSVQLEPTGYGKYGSRYYGRYGRYERNRYYRTYDYSYSTKEKNNG